MTMNADTVTMPFNWEASGGYEKVLFAATEALRALGATEKDKARKYHEVFAKAKEMFPQLTTGSTAVAENSFTAYLSQTVKDETSLINCEGPWKGYYLLSAELAAKTMPSAVPAAAPDERKRKEKELLLYPAAVKWLQSLGYRCDDTSSLRKLGKWGNPDITGLLVTETVGAIDVEVATVEVKTSSDDWEYWIFEAVAHRRFANRAHFAFAHPEELSLKLPGTMRYYSELYHIGILAFVLDNQAFSGLQTGTLTSPLNPSEVFVQEIHSAPFMNVPSPAKKRFLEDGLGLREYRQVCTWGKPLADD